MSMEHDIRLAEIDEELHGSRVTLRDPRWLSARVKHLQAVIEAAGIDDDGRRTQSETIDKLRKENEELLAAMKSAYLGLDRVTKEVWAARQMLGKAF